MGPALREEYKFKVIILGDTGVGKSTLLHRFNENVYRCTTATISAEFSSQSLEVDPGVYVTLNMWDTSGMERYRALTRNYYRNVAGCLLVFDLTNPASFDHIKDWYDDLCKSQGSNNVVFGLVGQKCDDLPSRKVKREDAEQLAGELGMPYVETSALTGDNVKETFVDLARRIKNEGILTIVMLDEHRDGIVQAGSKKKCCN